MRKALEFSAFVSFFALVGTVGAMDCETISMAHGIVQGIICFAAMCLFTKVADELYEKSRSRKCEFRKAASVKAQFDYTTPESNDKEVRYER